MHRFGMTTKGFSLVELIAVLVLLSIVSVTVVSRLNFSPFQTASFDQELRTAIRFAQKFAIASGCNVQVSIVDAGNSYALTLNDGVNLASAASCLSAAAPGYTVALPNPAGGTFSGVAPAGVDVVGDVAIIYDAEGVPSAGDSVTVNGSLITIEPVTGYVY